MEYLILEIEDKKELEDYLAADILISLFSII